MATKPKNPPETANDEDDDRGLDRVSPISKELVIALVGYAGAGTSTAGKRISALLEAQGYTIYKVRFSDLIARLDGKAAPAIEEGNKEGRSRFDRAEQFQDRGDHIRNVRGHEILAVAAVEEIQKLRGSRRAGTEKIAFILDSLKHPAEVGLLRKVYDQSFRLVAVHCHQYERMDRLYGDETSTVKYGGVSKEEINRFIERDAKDGRNKHGQSVRDVFHLADFFLDNSPKSHDGAGMNADINRFLKLLLGIDLVRPTAGEKAIYVAFASALQSACLSRQVGAALISSDGRLVATGKNDPPKFGGGTYDEDSDPDHRCFAWKFSEGDIEFIGCHNDRKKSALYREIANWMAGRLSIPLASRVIPPEPEWMGMDPSEDRREALAHALSGALADISDEIDGMPGVKDAIEYSRSIHAEMAALMAAARGGISTIQSTMYVTVFPCHNCARHLVAAGVKAVFYIEPYVKSLAFELHSDSISPEGPDDSAAGATQMVIAPFTGVGPRMYDDYFVKRTDLKTAGGRYVPQAEGQPAFAVRLRELESVEAAVIDTLHGLGGVSGVTKGGKPFPA